MCDPEKRYDFFFFFVIFGGAEMIALCVNDPIIAFFFHRDVKYRVSYISKMVINHTHKKLALDYFC